MTTNVWFMIASAFCVVSIVCSVLAVIGCAKTRRAIRQARKNLDSAELARQGFDASNNYHDLSNGQCYREYGDLS